MEQTTTKLSVMNVFKFAGAIIAFLIGSGFASGQEVLQFFTNYGLKGILGVFVAMTLFVVLGAVLMRYGFNHRNELASNGIRHYCGKIFGTFMEWYTPFFCFLIGVIMVSGAGATVNEYFGWPNLVGTVGMTVIVFITTLFGFNRLIDIISYLGPLTILFTIVIAGISLLKNPGGLATADDVLRSSKGIIYGAGNQSFSWVLSAFLFVANNIVVGVPFITVLGKSAKNKKEAVLGGVFAGIALMASALLLNLAMLSEIGQVLKVQVPVLLLAGNISPIISFFFSLILLEEIFSTAAPMTWTVAYSLVGRNASKNKYRLIILALTIITFVISQVPFGQLVAVIYPITGYIGVILIFLIIGREIYDFVKHNRSTENSAELAENMKVGLANDATKDK